MTNLVWLVPVLPLLGFAIIGLMGRRLPETAAGWLGSATVLGSFLVTLMVFFEQREVEAATIVPVLDWFEVGRVKVGFSFLVDHLSTLFMLIITGVGFLIHVYSTGYMHADAGYRRFFAYLNLFVFFMLLLVMADNFLLTFVGWEGVGLCSYLLIGFWFDNTAYNDAARKAFIMNRIGDLAFIFGVVMIYMNYGALDYATVFANPAAATPAAIGVITLLLFVGCTGKSAQIPLYTWLPDAMAGPTPVSALIHAATMVTAGIYLIARSSAMFALAPDTMEIIAWVGLATSLLGAVIGIYQTDIKKVLAYSTVSQLGLMFLGLGVGAFAPAVFHVTTHAFFKALLFLGAGSVIHAMSGEQDMGNMGGLRKALPTTFLTMLIGTVAISGIPPFSGFFSKDGILMAVTHHSPLMGWLATASAFITAFYMFRLMFLTFWGQFRGTHEQQHHLHESPASMTVPLIVLAGLAAVAGFWGMPQFSDMALLPNYFGAYLHSAIPVGHAVEVSFGEELPHIAITIVGTLAMIIFAYSRFVSKGNVPVAEADMNGFQRLVYHKFYVDELYNSLVTKPLDAASGFAYRFFEVKGVDGLVNGVGSSTLFLGGILRKMQTGSLGFYLFVMVLGMAAMILVGAFM